MKPTTLFLSLAVAVIASPAIAQLQPGNPLSGIEKFKDFEARRASSCDPDWRNGNEDARPIAAGGTLVLADLKGPGVITHIWNTINHEAQFYSRLMTLRIYWDGEEQPSVECPIGDFFGIGHGMDQSFMSIPIRVTSNGKARNCYWPMPFRKSARITVTNESDKPCKWFYFYVDWQKHESLPADTAYFHAMYRQEFPCVMGRNYLIAALEGRGHYVGTIQSVYLMSKAWYGEGDDFFFIDGETEPSLRGTGTEDYFCDAWGFRQQDGPFYGTPLWEGNNPGGRGSAYRFHLADPVPFKKSLRAEIEHKGAQIYPGSPRVGFIERDDLMSSVAFWYQGEPHKPWPALPPGPERLPFREATLSVGWEAVAEARHSDGPVRAEKLRQIATGDKYFLFNSADAKGWVEIPFRVEKAMDAELWGRMIQSTNDGTYRVSLNGKEIGVVDLRADDFVATSHVWGRHQLAAGEHVLRFECVGKAANSMGYALGFDALVARTFAYTRPPGFDLRKIQFIK